MTGTGFIIVYITAQAGDEAELIARALTERRQAACVNIVPGITSHYWWEGEARTSEEWLLIVKTRATLFNDVTATTRELSSYSVPEIIAVPIVEGAKESLEWLELELPG